MIVRLSLVLALCVTVACASEAGPTAGSPIDALPPAPTPTGELRFDDHGIRFTYRSPWFIESEAADLVSLVNHTLSQEELDRRAAIDAYGAQDGEGFFQIWFGEPYDLAEARDEECRVGGPTRAVHGCSSITVDGREALWVLADHANGGTCTCRTMIINGTERGFRLTGGGCTDCAGTHAILSEVETMMRSVRLS